MTDTIEVEIDGVVDDGPPRRAPAWGLPAAIAVVGVLALAVIVRVVAPGLMTDQAPAGERTPASASPAAPAPEDARIVAARAALAAWGRFSVTGNLALLATHFDPMGSQYRQLVGEADTIRSGAGHGVPYDVSLDDVQVSTAGSDEALVTAMVTWARPGEAGQRYSWEIALKAAVPGQWRLWTVRDRETAAAGKAQGVRSEADGSEPTT